MCGRVTLTIDFDTLREILKTKYHIQKPHINPYNPRYNIAPSQPLATLIHDGENFRAGELTWGITPAWQQKTETSRPLANARAESIDQKPSFRDSFQKKRCIILADSYYEWRTTFGDKSPFRVKRKDDGLLYLAGLWSSQVTPDGKQHSCVVITTAANDLIKPIHHRMPALLDEADVETWVRPDTPVEKLHALLQPYRGDQLTLYEVSKLVNNARIDAPDCIDPIEHLISTQPYDFFQ